MVVGNGNTKSVYIWEFVKYFTFPSFPCQVIKYDPNETNLVSLWIPCQVKIITLKIKYNNIRANLVSYWIFYQFIFLTLNNKTFIGTFSSAKSMTCRYTFHVKILPLTMEFKIKFNSSVRWNQLNNLSR